MLMLMSDDANETYARCVSTNRPGANQLDFARASSSIATVARKDNSLNACSGNRVFQRASTRWKRPSARRSTDTSAQTNMHAQGTKISAYVRCADPIGARASTAARAEVRASPGGARF